MTKRIRTSIEFDSIVEREKIIKYCKEHYGSLSQYVRNSILNEIAGKKSTDETVNLLKDEITDLKLKIDVLNNNFQLSLDLMSKAIKLGELRSKDKDLQDIETKIKNVFKSDV